MSVLGQKRTLFYALALAFCWMISASTIAFADEPAANAPNATPETATLDQQQPDATAPPPPPKWEYNAFVDVAYLLDFNHPANHLFRDRSTTFKVDELDLNMAGAGVKKEASQHSRWGMELSAQGGKDSINFGFSATAPNVYGANVLRHFGAANVSYLTSVGKGLTVQGGL